MTPYHFRSGQLLGKKEPRRATLACTDVPQFVKLFFFCVYHREQLKVSNKHDREKNACHGVGNTNFELGSKDINTGWSTEIRLPSIPFS